MHGNAVRLHEGQGVQTVLFFEGTRYRRLGIPWRAQVDVRHLQRRSAIRIEYVRIAIVSVIESESADTDGINAIAEVNDSELIKASLTSD